MYSYLTSLMCATLLLDTLGNSPNQSERLRNADRTNANCYVCYERSGLLVAREMVLIAVRSRSLSLLILANDMLGK